jgi:hypothetical protein
VVTVGPRNGDTERTVRIRYARVGNTSVDPPEWAANATVTPRDEGD